MTSLRIWVLASLFLTTACASDAQKKAEDGQTALAACDLRGAHDDFAQAYAHPNWWEPTFDPGNRWSLEAPHRLGVIVGGPGTSDALPTFCAEIVHVGGLEPLAARVLPPWQVRRREPTER